MRGRESERVAGPQRVVNSVGSECCSPGPRPGNAQRLWWVRVVDLPVGLQDD